MQTQFFDTQTGHWPKAIDWTEAVLGTLLAATASTLTTTDLELSNRYFAELVAFYFGQHSMDLKGQAYDDIMWVVLNWIEAVKTIDHRAGVLPPGSWTGSEWKGTFAARAFEFYQLAQRGWDEQMCDGGMFWSPDPVSPYKNAITNELYISTSIAMYLHHPNPARNETYLWNAIRAHEWLKASNMTDNSGLYTDGYHIKNWRNGGNKCDERDEMVYTYNQGVILSALRGLADSTENDEYIIEGLQLVDAVLMSEGSTGELVFDGVLTEKCDPSGYCSQDSQTFKGIFMHHLTTFCRPLPHGIGISSATTRTHRISCTRYKNFIERSASSALKTRNKSGVMGMWWGVPAGLVTSKDANHDTRPPGTLDISNMCAFTFTVEQCEAAQRGRRRLRGDLNDRGQGRSVESHSGGLAALRAVLELERGDIQLDTNQPHNTLWVMGLSKSLGLELMEFMVVCAAMWLLVRVWGSKGDPEENDVDGEDKDGLPPPPKLIDVDV
ncbi:glycosyl hydrolase family 76-domain-containing protein [Trichophaea hybrida]|nr:glycosyl hydrolase family 76-domain-containing protein [Trichophaea hybrida]